MMRPFGKPPPSAMSSVKAPDGMHSLQRQSQCQAALLLVQRLHDSQLTVSEALHCRAA